MESGAATLHFSLSFCFPLCPQLGGISVMETEALLMVMLQTDRGRIWFAVIIVADCDLERD